MTLDLDSEELEEQVEEFLSHATNASHHDHVVVLPNTYPRYGASQLKMQDELLKPQPKHLSEHRTPHYHTTMEQTTAC